jgi:putative spermidine/putrescine transport system permease protein
VKARILWLGLMLLFLIGPFAVIAAASLSAGETLAFPPQGLSLRWFGKVFEIESFRASFALSLFLAIAATALALALGVPAAYALTRYRVPFAEPLRQIVSSPILVPGIVVGLALLRYLVAPLGFPLTPALLIAHVALILPYALRVVSASLVNLKPEIEEAAVLLGASRLGAFWSVVAPNIRDGVLAASVLGFVTSFNQVPVSLFLSGPGVETLPIDMLGYLEITYDPSVAALSTLLALLSVAIVVAAERFLGLTRYV